MPSSRRSSRSVPAASTGLFALLAVLALAGCGTAAPSSGAVTVRDAWVRAPMGDMTAGYLVIENGTATADVLTSVTAPSGATVALHRTTTDPSGMTGMEPVDGIHVPAGGTVELAPGGFHMMIGGLPATTKAGDHVELHLVFEHAGTVVVQAEVRGS
ncbi:MAG TPA: copper chaperone PCu(A)C [Candidatus Acidoferrales bacterium]|nr:copper chaperone PCu(A)C [Candidatus Acidoferrales bacterium]